MGKLCVPNDYEIFHLNKYLIAVTDVQDIESFSAIVLFYFFLLFCINQKLSACKVDLYHFFTVEMIKCFKSMCDAIYVIF